MRRMFCLSCGVRVDSSLVAVSAPRRRVCMSWMDDSGLCGCMR